MPADLGEDLRRAAPRPAREAPFGLIEERLRMRRRRKQGAVAGMAMLVAGVVAAGAVALTSSSGDAPTVAAVRPGTPTGAGTGVTVDLPPGWVRTPVMPSSGPGDPAVLLAVGTSLMPRDPGLCGPAPSDEASIVIGELTAGEPINGIPPAPLLTRPADFADANPLSEARYACTPSPGGSQPSGERVVTTFTFTEQDRVLTIRLAFGSAASAQRRAEAYEVMNSLRVQPRTTGTEPVPSTVPGTIPTTTAPPTTPASAEDDAAIRETFRIWLDTQPRDDPAIGEHIEDYESIREAIRQAADTAPLPLDGYHGRVDEVGLLDDTHAVVRFAILHGADVVYDAAGRAVRVDGVWKVSRETVCDALTVGGTTCPPRR